MLKNFKKIMLAGFGLTAIGIMPVVASSCLDLGLNNGIPGFAKITLGNDAKLFPNGDTSLQINTKEDMEKLCTVGDEKTTIKINGVTFPKKDVLSIKFGTDFYGTNINNNFLSNFTNLNGDLTIPNCVKYIGNDFMTGCTKFNSKVKFGIKLEFVGDNFMSKCVNFNKELFFYYNQNFKIANNFLDGCKKFNSYINLPDSTQEIGNNFLLDCENFNQPMDGIFKKGLTKLGTEFMSGCLTFDQKLDMRNAINLSSIGDGFVYRCNELTEINFGEIKPGVFSGIQNKTMVVLPADFENFSQYQGINIKCKYSNAKSIRSTITDFSDANVYRKIKLDITQWATFTHLDGIVTYQQTIVLNRFNALNNVEFLLADYSFLDMDETGCTIVPKESTGFCGLIKIVYYCKKDIQLSHYSSGTFIINSTTSDTVLIDEILEGFNHANGTTFSLGVEVDVVLGPNRNGTAVLKAIDQTPPAPEPAPEPTSDDDEVEGHDAEPVPNSYQGQITLTYTMVDNYLGIIDASTHDKIIGAFNLKNNTHYTNQEVSVLVVAGNSAVLEWNNITYFGQMTVTFGQKTSLADYITIKDLGAVNDLQDSTIMKTINTLNVSALNLGTDVTLFNKQDTSVILRCPETSNFYGDVTITYTKIVYNTLSLRFTNTSTQITGDIDCAKIGASGYASEEHFKYGQMNIRNYNQTAIKEKIADAGITTVDFMTLVNNGWIETKDQYGKLLGSAQSSFQYTATCWNASYKYSADTIIFQADWKDDSRHKDSTYHGGAHNVVYLQNLGGFFFNEQLLFNVAANGTLTVNTVKSKNPLQLQVAPPMRGIQDRVFQLNVEMVPLAT